MNKPPPGHLRESIVLKPVAHVHEYVKRNPYLTRSQMVHALHDQGVAWYTARTQVDIARKNKCQP